MEQRCPRRGRLYWLSLHKNTSRQVIADVQKHITKLQTGAHLPSYSAWVFESRGGLHAHILFIGDRSGEIEGRLCGSKSFGSLIDVRQVYDLEGLIKRYLAKERTPQAGYNRQHILGGRIQGSHRLEGGGDRVRLSRELERDAIEAGYVGPWRHTNAKRSAVRKAYSPRRRAQVASAPIVPTAAPDELDGECAAACEVSTRLVGILCAPLRPIADANRPIFDKVDALAAVVRSAKAQLARARTSAAKLAESVADLAKTIDVVEGINRDLIQARSEVQSKVGSMGNGDPPLDDARSRLPPETAGAMNIPPLPSERPIHRRLRILGVTVCYNQRA
jgi:hypothetical protein